MAGLVDEVLYPVVEAEVGLPLEAEDAGVEPPVHGAQAEAVGGQRAQGAVAESRKASVCRIGESPPSQIQGQSQNWLHPRKVLRHFGT